ncbi:MAG: hypothetical protein ACTSXG_01570 [Alphaproteobacteria bacterium]
MKTVYDNGGECLGDEFIDLSRLQEDTKKAILQMVYLDKTLDIHNDQIHKLETIIGDIQSSECPRCYRVKGIGSAECTYCSWDERVI